LKSIVFIVVPLLLAVGLLTCQVNAAESRVVSFDNCYCSVALLDNGTVWMWGLGVPVPEMVEVFTGVRQVSALHNGCVVLKDDGSVWMWQNDTQPVRVTTMDNVKQVCTNYALKNDGTVWRWAKTWNPRDPSDLEEAPVPIRGLTSITFIDYNGGLKDDGTVWEWKPGDDTASQVSIDNVKALCDRPGHGLALKNDGTVWAWGSSNSLGQLGDGTTQPSSVPVQVKGLNNIVAISASYYNNLALKDDRSLWAWGDNAKGELGDPSIRDYSSTPIKMPGVSDIDQFYAGMQYSIYSKKDGSVWAVGINSQGDLGVGWITDWLQLKPHAGGEEKPVKVLLPTGLTKLTPTPTLKPTASPVPSVSPIGTPTTTSPTAGGTTMPSPTTQAPTGTPTPLPSQASGFDFTMIMAMIGLVMIGSLVYSITKK
jgi:hypothetical protein